MPEPKTMVNVWVYALCPACRQQVSWEALGIDEGPWTLVDAAAAMRQGTCTRCDTSLAQARVCGRLGAGAGLLMSAHRLVQMRCRSRLTDPPMELFGHIARR